MCRSQGLSRTLPLDEVSPFTSLEAPTWEQDHPAPQRGLQEGPAQILLWMVIASGSLTKHHKVYARESGFREWKTRLLWQILSGNDWGLQRASHNYSPAATILTTLWWGIGYSHLVLCPARQLRSPSVLPSYCLSTPEPTLLSTVLFEIVKPCIIIYNKGYFENRCQLNYCTPIIWKNM